MHIQTALIQLVGVNDGIVPGPAAGKFPVRRQIEAPAKVRIFPAVVNIRMQDFSVTGMI